MQMMELYIGKDDKEQTVGISNAIKLVKEIPNKIKDTMGIIPEVLLRNLGLYDGNYLNNAAILLFGKEPNKWILGSYIQKICRKKFDNEKWKTKFERRYYKDNETGENVCLTDKILGLETGERIDKKVKAEVIRKANDQSYSKSGKLVVPEMEISSTTVMRNVRKNDWKMNIEERKELVDKFTFSG